MKYQLIIIRNNIQQVYSKSTASLQQLINPLVVNTRWGYKLITYLGFSDFIGLMYEIKSEEENLEFLVSELSKVAFTQP